MKQLSLFIGLSLGAWFGYIWQPPVHNYKSTSAKGSTPGMTEYVSRRYSDTVKYRFTKDASAERMLIDAAKNIQLAGYKTANHEIFSALIEPYIQQHRTRLQKLSYPEIINECTLLSYKIYYTFIGKSFYRWGGDIADIDDPQYEGVRYTKRYGLDCSGFATSGYEIATRCGLIPDTAAFALFCSAGLKHFTASHPFRLRGAILGGNNNYRLDTSELAELGSVIFSLKKGERPSELQISSLQAGDIVGLDGHVGIIVFIDGHPYYLESGGYVLPEHGYQPVPAATALAEFASHCGISVRRAGK